MMKLRHPYRLGLLLAACAALTSCGSDSSNNVSFRMIQASPDLPLVNLIVDNTVLRAAIDYKGGPGFLTVTPDTYEFGLEAPVVGEDGAIIDVPLLLPTVQKSLVDGYEYTLITIGKAATQTVQPLVVENVTAEVPQGNARLQFVHAAPDVPAVVDIYLTAVPDPPELLPDLSPQDVPIAQVNYGQQPAPWQLVPVGRYVIRVTYQDSKDPVFVSDEILLSNGNDFLMVAVDNTAAGPSPISLAVSSGFRVYWNPTGTFSIFDRNSPAELRTVQVSPDAPALDVLGYPESAPTLSKTFAAGLTYLASTGYVPTTPDTYTLTGVKTSTPTATPPLFAVVGTLLVGVRTTLFTTGAVDSLVPLVLPGDIRPVFAQGKLRIVDASLSSNAVDVYILAPGTDYADASVTPTLAGLVFRSATGYLPLFPRNYRVTFTVAGSKEFVAAEDVAATAGTVQTAVLVDAVRVDSSSDGQPESVLLLDDRASP